MQFIALTKCYVFISTLLSIATYNDAAKPYCVPHNATGGPSECWPSKKEWDSLAASINGRMQVLLSTEKAYKICEDQGKNAFKISKTGHGSCMQYHDCSKVFCDKNQRWNIPAYSVEVFHAEDIQATLAFAKRHNIAVTVKTSGHSYAGSSMGYGTLLIWMYSFQKHGTIKKTFQDTCGMTYSNALHLGGGQTWKEAYDAVGSKYHIVGGGGLTVSAAGGWLMGGGLSAMSRYHGMGIDNVLTFEVILANGTLVVADKCTNPDLFWALRGGGGGSFGVVTSVHYQLHPVQPVILATLEISDIYSWPYPRETVDSWIDLWVDKSPHLDNRWGGYWTLNGFILYFLGNMENATNTFLDDMYRWKSSLVPSKQLTVKITATPFTSYYDSRGGRYASTDETGQKEFNIASWLIPRDWVLNSSKAKDTLKWLVSNGFYTFNYLLGGVMTDVGTKETSVNPAMRKAIWQINDLLGDKMIRKLRDVVPDSGAGYNHASKSEPDWRNAFWGENLNRLTLIKEQYDPENRFNCWHCIGYEEMPLSPPSESSRATSSLSIICFCFILSYLVK